MTWDLYTIGPLVAGVAVSLALIVSVLQLVAAIRDKRRTQHRQGTGVDAP